MALTAVKVLIGGSWVTLPLSSLPINISDVTSLQALLDGIAADITELQDSPGGGGISLEGGSGYTAMPTARLYVGLNSPAAPPDGSVWFVADTIE